MAKFRKVYAEFWKDEKIDIMTPEDKYFYLFLLTNPEVTECGIYKITRKMISHYTGYNLDSIDNLLKRFVDYKVIYYSKDTSEIVIVDQLCKQPNFGKPMLDCITSELNKVSNKDLILLAMENVTDKALDPIKVRFC